MALRYYYFQTSSLPVDLVVAQLAPAAAFAVVAPTFTETPFTVVSIDYTVTNEEDLIAAMASLGYTFVAAALVAPPAFGTVQDYGKLAVGPTAPVPSAGDQCTIGGVPHIYNGTVWVPTLLATNNNLTVAPFSGSGILAVSNNVGMWWWNRTGRELTIIDATMWRQLSGTAGSTIGDVEVDATGTGVAFASIYIPGDRPTIGFGTSPDFVQANTFASTAVPNGAIVRFNLDQVESGSPQNILLQLSMTG